MPDSERQFATTEVLAAYDKSLEVLRGLGAEIVPINLPFAFNDLTRAVGRIISPEAYAILHDLVDNDSIPLDEDVRPRVTVGKRTMAYEYVEALRLRDELKRKFAQAMAGIDALLTPTTGSVALPIAEVDQSGTPAHFTRFGNFLELCALALPNGLSTAGLPTSLQIVCRGHDEAMALRIGWAFQNATDWHLRRPPQG
jgi:aspartyl-tRNA(Asn)/glutamyl-tRNA(Gln) amidotransferase subunit A